jgi:hypothetical protein
MEADMAESDLTVLLRTMEPVLFPEPYGFAVWGFAVGGASSGGPAVGSGPVPFAPFATVAEDEGLTVVAPLERMRAAGMVSDPWARISLTVHSDLAAIGLTAAFAGALGRVGISCNVIAGYHHDHLFVQWDRRADAMAALIALTHA